MAETKPNVELLKRTLAHIEAHPKTWEQDRYRCGTGMCFAGWAATLAGGRWVIEDLTDPPPSDEAEYMVAEPEEGGEAYGKVWAPERARRVLGLTHLQASRLFAGQNHIDDLRRLVGELCEETS